MLGLPGGLKRILAGLARQNAGEFLPLREKIKVRIAGVIPKREGRASRCRWC
jgi:predicted transcriptional regulator